MQIEINNNKWIISEHNPKEILDEYKKRIKDNSTTCFGLTFYGKHEIWINEDMCKDEKKLTLRHELMHAYLWSVGCCNFAQFDEEDVCNFSAKSSWIINRIMEAYFKEE